MQLDRAEKGFSFMRDGPLDMRMDPEQRLSAYEVVNQFSEKKLADIIYEFGEERRSRQVAKAIVEARRRAKIATTKELADIVSQVAAKKKKLHPATLTFQALRLYVNNELEELETGLLKAIDALNPGGIIGVIAFHRLEDRIVKNVFRDEKGKRLEDVSKKPIVPGEEEVRRNPRARSAKMRFAKKKL